MHNCMEEDYFERHAMRNWQFGWCMVLLQPFLFPPMQVSNSCQSPCRVFLCVNQDTFHFLQPLQMWSTMYSAVLAQTMLRKTNQRTRVTSSANKRIMTEKPTAHMGHHPMHIVIAITIFYSKNWKHKFHMGYQPSHTTIDIHSVFCSNIWKHTFHIKMQVIWVII